MKNKTIMQCVPHLGVGGAEKIVALTSAAIVASGGRALVVRQASDTKKETEPAIISGGGEIISLPIARKNPVSILLNARRLAGLIREYRVDIIHAHSRAPAWACLLAAKLAGIPYISTYHTKVHFSPAWKKFYNSGLVRGRLTIANSQWTSARVARAYNLPPSKLKTIPLGCDIASLSNVDDKMREAKRREWGVGADDFVILCAGRLKRTKGHHILLSALAKVKDTSPRRAKLVFVGATAGAEDYVAWLKSQAAKLGLAGRLAIVGSDNNMPAVYAAADLLAAPALVAETFGLVIIEAHAARRAVIAADAGGYRETIAPKGGWLVAPADADAWGAALAAALATAPAELEAMGEAGHRFVVENYGQDKMCERTLDVYREILK